jgi:hypothetical protein
MEWRTLIVQFTLLLYISVFVSTYNLYRKRPPTPSLANSPSFCTKVTLETLHLPNVLSKESRHSDALNNRFCKISLARFSVFGCASAWLIGGNGSCCQVFKRAYRSVAVSRFLLQCKRRAARASHSRRDRQVLLTWHRQPPPLKLELGSL